MRTQNKESVEERRRRRWNRLRIRLTENVEQEDTSRHLLRCYSPPVSVNTIFEVEHSQPPDVHIQHVVIEDILRAKTKICLADIAFMDSNGFPQNSATLKDIRKNLG